MTSDSGSLSPGSIPLAQMSRKPSDVTSQTAAETPTPQLAPQDTVEASGQSNGTTPDATKQIPYPLRRKLFAERADIPEHER